MGRYVWVALVCGGGVRVESSNVQLDANAVVGADERLFPTGRRSVGGCARMCPDGQVCAASKCSAAPACPMGQMMCAQQCTDLTSDPANCASCGVSCVSGTCTSSKCSMVGCNGALMCLDACDPSDATCPPSCTAAGMITSQGTLTCLKAPCPTTGGGTRDTTSMSFDSGTCQTRQSNAEAMGAMCASQATA